MRTVNGPQVSGYTQMAGTVVPACLPNPPTGVTGVPGNNQVTVSWIPPVNSGVTITGYRVQFSTNSGTTWTTAVDLNVPSTSTVVAGLTNYVGYVLPPGGPSAPTSVFAVAGNASANVGWTASAGTPGFAIIGYRATASPGGQSCTTNATATAPAPNTCTVTGLNNGQAHTFTVEAISNTGTSTLSRHPSP